MKQLEKKKYEYYDKGESSATSASKGHDRRLRKEGKAEMDSLKSESKNCQARRTRQ